MELSPSQVIVLATPVFFLLIGLEYAWGLAKSRNTYRLNDAINSISLGMLSQLSAVVMPLLRIGIPDDIAGAAVFLGSAAGDFMTGQTMVIDGGATIS